MLSLVRAPALLVAWLPAERQRSTALDAVRENRREQIGYPGAPIVSDNRKAAEAKRIGKIQGENVRKPAS
ncbi:hypothetical protein X734_19185 [Mesorhizobium sp. L2C084A000]|nr:hypothetical protein X734_19185 [Mesorhizobium sp. L2C084A000]